MKRVYERIKKMQTGGMFSVYRPLPMAQQAGTPPITGGGNASAAPEEESLINEDVMKALMGEGLTNDVMHFSDDLQRAYSEYSNMSDILKASQYGQHLRNKLRGDWGMLNNIRRNKTMMDEAASKIKDNDADNDFAVTPNGVVVKNLETGEVGEVSHAQYSRDYAGKEEYKILTNAELVTEREYNPSLTGDTRTLSILNNAKGITKVKEEIVSILSNLGNESNTAAKESYILYGGVDNQALAEGARSLIGQGLAGFYKVGQSESQDTNITNLKLAQETMWMNLSSSAKSLLKARALSDGVDYNDLEAYAKEQAISLLAPAAKVSTSSSDSVNYDSTMTTAASGGGEDAYTGSTDFWENAANFIGQQSSYRVDMGDGDTLDLLTTAVGPLHSGGSPQGIKPIREITELYNFGDMNNVYMGNVKMDRSDLNSIVYSGEQAHVAEIPVTYNPQTEEYIPMFDKLKAYNDVQDELASVDNASARETIISNNGFVPYKDAQGVVQVYIETAPFLMFDGMANSKGKPELAESPLLDRVSETEYKTYRSQYEYGNFTEDGEQVVGTDDYSWFQFGKKRSVYRGVVFVKMPTDIHGAPMRSVGRSADANPYATTKYRNSAEHVASSVRPNNSSNRANKYIYDGQ